MYRSYRGQGFSPWMGIVGLLVLLFLFSKGLWFLPFIFMFGMFMMRKGGHHHHFQHHGHHHHDWDEFEKRKNDAYEKRKHDERFDEYKRKNDGEDVYYV